MSERSENIKVFDKLGFIYAVEIKHFPHLGFSTAYYRGNIIAQREYGKISEPMSDNDAEWERYEELFGEWSDAAKSDLKPECESYFNQSYKRKPFDRFR